MIYRQSADVVKRQIAGEVFLVPVKRSLADMRNLFVLHGAAELVWDCIERGADTVSIRERLVSEYDVEPEKAEADVERFLSELAGAGLAGAVEA